MLLQPKINKYGRISIIDFSIVLFILITLPLLFQVAKIMGKRPAMITHTWIDVKAVAFLKPEAAKLLKPGDTAYDGLGQPEGKLVNIAIINDTPFLEFRLRCTKSMEGEQWYYRRAPLFITLDEPFFFVTDKYRIDCHPVEIRG